MTEIQETETGVTIFELLKVTGCVVEDRLLVLIHEQLDYQERLKIIQLLLRLE
jgi:hypothetical protein